MNKAQFILLPPCQWTFSLFPGFYNYIQYCCEELEFVPWGIGMKDSPKCLPRSKMGWVVGLVPLQLYNELSPKVIILSSSNKSSYYFTFLPILINVWFKFFCQFGGYEMVYQFISFTRFSINMFVLFLLMYELFFVFWIYSLTAFFWSMAFIFLSIVSF